MLSQILSIFKHLEASQKHLKDSFQINCAWGGKDINELTKPIFINTDCLDMFPGLTLSKVRTGIQVHHEPILEERNLHLNSTLRNNNIRLLGSWINFH